MSEFDASRAAARAVGETVEEASDDDVQEAAADAADRTGDGGTDGATSTSASASSSSESAGLRETVQQMLTSTEPNPPLEAVDDPWNPEAGGTARIYRGLQKMLGVDGIPAIGDLLIGVLEASNDDGTGSSSSADAGDDRDEEDDDVGEMEARLVEEGIEGA